jgi:hypothetical protein
MKDFDHLMSVWQAQPKKEHLSVDEVLKQVKKRRTQFNLRMYWAIIAMIAYAGLGIYMMFFMAFKSPATTVGILICMLHGNVPGDHCKALPYFK